LVSPKALAVRFGHSFERIGPQRALTATFLVPPLGIAWGWLLLDEMPTTSMLTGMLITLAGTALATGVVGEKS